ncbi:iron dicitrate transport regulator FecR [Leptospira perolatii]|uniref:Iron dicitrate transport regulator FecR n=1 Tax=Leptospira perolatii TaxID=2023191 RepID=A0A2M9ZNA5_9LEPT|nr:FecR family protein [Leptospira perolatii]PJZ68711.1 iron dicitrate transport regulator FecR [Leptospira perolatii]PJZ73547.1 iron dicitrate transport regulator FecR [Leptospira perolatii]
MKQKLLIAISLALSLGSLVILSQNVEEKDARVAFLLGKVQVQKQDSGKWTSLKLGDPVSEGDVVWTGNGSKTTLMYRGSEFRVLPNTKLKVNGLHGENKDGKLEVQSGFAWFHIVNLKGKKFEAGTPTTTAGVRGTSFSAFFDAKSKDSSFCTCEGKVAVSNKEQNGEGTLLEKGNGGYYSGGMGDPKKVQYEGIITKFKALPPFKEMMKKNISLKNCLSCHKPEGWTPEQSSPADETYGK